MIDIQKAIKFPFEQKGWESKLGVLFLVYLFVYLISTFTNFGSEYASTLSDFQTTGRMQEVPELLRMNTLPITIWSGMLSLLLIPVSLYIAGYEFSVTRNVMKKKDDVLEQPTDVGSHFKLGLVKLGLSIPVTFVYILLLVVLALFAFSVNPLPSVNQNITMMLVIWGFYLVFSVALGVLVYFLNTSIYYNYLKDRKFWGAFNIGKMLSTLKAGWKEFLVVVGYGVLIGIGAFVVNLALCCLTFVVSPAMTMYTQLVTAHLTGQAFQILAARKV
jgi:hypothetical protein